MSFRDFHLTVFVCFSLATSAIVTRLVVTDLNVPALVFATTRSLIVVVLMSPWLLPIPKPKLHFLLTATLLGMGGFSLFFIGLAQATPSAAAIVQQISIPLTTLFGVFFLGERIGPQRIVGTGLALVGIILVMAKPSSLSVSGGLLWVAASALCGSIAIVLIKKFAQLEPLRLQAWVGTCAAIPSFVLTSALDTAPWQRAWQAGWLLFIASAYSAIVVSILAQGINYRLVHRTSANTIAPLMVMAPLFTMILGHLITHDVVTTTTLAGAATTISGIIVITYRPRRANKGNRVRVERNPNHFVEQD